MDVPTCYPGIVKFCSRQMPPSKKKWATVEVPQGAVKVDMNHAMLSKPGFGDRPKAREDFLKEDLAKLDWPAARTFSHALAGIACSQAYPMVSAKTGYVCAKALLGRIFRQPAPKPWGGTGPYPGLWKKAREFVQYLLPHFRSEKMPVDEWIASMPSSRRKPLLRAAEALSRRGWDPSYEKFSAFVKTELLPGFDKDEHGIVELTQMLDRLIQGPRDETHVIAGPWLKPLVHELKKCWTYDGPIFYGSCGPEPLHKWLQSFVADGERQYFWCDFSMFDNTHSQDSWEFMESLYKEAGIIDPLFDKVMDAWRKPKGKIGPFKYEAPIMNASGRDDTALANGILNGFASYLSACAALLEKSLFDLTLDDVMGCRPFIKLSVCGDDSLGSLPPMTEERMAKWRADMATNIAMFGFEAKLNSSTKLYDAVYLGMRPYPTRKGWFWGKTIGRSTYKMGFALLKPDMDVMAHITGIADAHVLCSSHVPILGDLAKKIVELRVGKKRTPKVLDPNRPWEWTYASGVPYDDLTLQAVADTYTQHDSPGNPTLGPGTTVTVADVKSLISAIESVQRLPCVVDHWLWRHMIKVDDL